MISHLKVVLPLIAAWATLSISPPILAEIVSIDFSSHTYIPPNDSAYIEDRFRFQIVGAETHSDCGPTVGAAIFGVTPFLVYCWHNGGGNTSIDRNAAVTFSDGSFDLISLDIAIDPHGENQGRPPFTMDLTSSAGSVTIAGNVPATITLNWQNISSFTMSINDAPGCVLDSCRHNAVIDNVVLNDVPTTPSVPEPSNLWLLGSGLTTGILFWQRRKSKSRNQCVENRDA